jgi:tetratricopeptide (TPR) repeat protein
MRIARMGMALLVGPWLVVWLAGCAASPSARHTNAAGQLFAQGRYLEAEPLVLAALKEAEAGSPSTNVQLKNLAIAWSNVGAVSLVLGRYDAAEASFRRAREVFQSFGDEVPAVGMMAQLGAVLTKQGRYVEAERVLREGLGSVAAAKASDGPGGSVEFLELLLQDEIDRPPQQPRPPAAARRRRLRGGGHTRGHHLGFPRQLRSPPGP